MSAVWFLMAVSALNSSATLNEQSVNSVKMSANGEFLAKHYPPRALKRGEQGKVGFRLVVEPSGSLGSCEVTQSSGFQTLDNETCEIIVRYARLTPVRDAEGRAVRAIQNGYINWKLPGRATRLASSSAAAGKLRDPERIICKRSETTGSLIKRTRTCLTANQWAIMHQQQREAAERMVRPGGFEDGDACPVTISNPAGGC